MKKIVDRAECSAILFAPPKKRDSLRKRIGSKDFEGLQALSFVPTEIQRPGDRRNVSKSGWDEFFDALKSIECSFENLILEFHGETRNGRDPEAIQGRI